jgi:hypothetical protein
LIGKEVDVGRLALTLAAVAAAAVTAAPSGSAAKPCWQVLVDDWADGAISNLYPISCYRQALQNMPEDVRLYSNASDDINRALAGRAVKRSFAGGVKSGGGGPATAAVVPGDDASSAPLVLAASLAALLALAGSAGYLVRRKWRGAARLGGPDS